MARPLMPTVTYVQPDGSRITCELAAGQSLMDGALDNHVPGIIGRCGGGCTCATCHCYVHEPHLSRLTPPGADEAELLEHLANRRPNSRLGCQVVADDACSGMVVEVPVSAEER